MVTLHWFVKKLNQLISALLMIFISLMVIAVIWQVFTRFVIQDPSAFTDELSRYLMIWVGILGGSYTFAIKRHLALEILMPKLTINRQHVLKIIINSLVLLFSAIVLIYGGSAFVIKAIQFNQISPTIMLFGHHLQIGYIYLVAPVSGAYIVICGLVDILDSIVAISNKDQRG